MADRKQNKKLAKIIAYMLGKAPGEFGLIPDGRGFVKIKALLQAMHDEDGLRHVRAATLNELALTLPDAGFEIKGNDIRSRQWDQLPQPVIAPAPPTFLYTCVRRKAYPHTLRKGVSPTAHSHVVLYPDRETAEKIGRRRSADPVVLTVHTEKAENYGIIFYQIGEALFLADDIPAGCFTGPALSREKEKKPAVKKPEPTAVPPAEGTRNRAGSFTITAPTTSANPGGTDKKKKRDSDWKRERKKMNRRGRRQWPDV